MAFDPDVFLAEKDSGFDPDAFLADGDASTKQKPSIPKTGNIAAAIEGAANNVPGTRFVGQVLDTGAQAMSELSNSMMGLPSSTKRISEAWDESGQRYDARSKAAEETNPWAYHLGGLPAALYTAWAMAPAAFAAKAPQLAAMLKAAPGAGELATAAALSAGQRSNAGDVTGTDVAADLAIGGGLGALGSKVANSKPVQYIGDKLQIGQRMADAAASIVGGTSLGKLIGGKPAEPGVLASARVKQLVSDAIPGTPNLKQEFTPEQILADWQTMANNGTPLDKAAAKLALAEREGKATLGPGRNWTADPGQFGEMFESAATRARNEAVNRFAPAEFKASEDVVGAMRNQAREAAQAHMKFETQQPLDEAWDMAQKARDFGEAATGMQHEKIGTLVDRASEIKAKINDSLRQAAEAGESNEFERKRVMQKAQMAQDELNRIQTGRQAIEKTAGALGGGAVGAHSGALGTMMGGYIGAKMGRGVFAGADMAGAVGQKLAAMDVPTLAAKAQQLATRDDAIGRAAQWALSGGDDAIARLYVLAKKPEIQMLLGEDR